MYRRLTLAVLIVSLLALAPLASAQDGANAIEPADMSMINADANISFPPPVYVVRDSLDIRGTVNLESMRIFFVEFRPLALDGMMAADDEPNEWLPATSPRIAPVIDDVLGTWNTLAVRDGLYELRLSINTGADEPSYFRVSPIRIENNPPDFLPEPQVVVVAEPTAMPDMPEPTEMPEPTDTPDSSPRVTALVNSNVRAGDSTSYNVVGGLREGETASILGISSFGTGWFYIELSTGRRGFIHPNLVTAEGELSNLKRVNPPPLPPTPIPQPTTVPAPSTGPNLRIINDQIRPHPPRCNQAYEVQVTVVNEGNAASGAFAITVRDSRHDGLGPKEVVIGGAPMAAGEQRTFGGNVTQSQYYNELHHINIYVDSKNEVPELNENDNHHADKPYILDKASCS